MDSEQSTKNQPDTQTDEAFKTVESVILARRTCKEFDGQPVAKELIEKLLTLATWAPNHRFTQPWRFRVCTQSGITKWIKHLREYFSDERQKLSEPKFKRMSQLGAIIYVTCIKDDNPLIHEENYAAVCAGVQNLLLGASSIGLGSFWSTGELMSLEESREFLGILERERFVGAIWLGYGKNPAPRMRTPAPQMTSWVD
jgi:nitroreductase